MYDIMELRLTNRTIILLLIFTVLMVYYPALFAPLIGVDDLKMYHYLHNSDDINLRSLFFPGGSGTYYRPLLTASFLLDKYAWGLEESFMHLQNIILHLCNALLVYAITRRSFLFLDVVSPVPAFLAALFFAVHPINTEAVNWVSGRTDLLAGFFVLLSFMLVIKYPIPWSWSLFAAICLFLACLAKETAVFFLPAALFLPFFLSRDEGFKVYLGTFIGKNIFHFLFFILSVSGYFALRALAFSASDDGVSRVATHIAGGQSNGIMVSVRLILKASGFYVKKLFVPFPLNFGITHVSDLYMIVGAALFVVMALFLVRRKLSDYFFLAAFSIGSSALMIPLLGVTWTPLAERYMYIPSAFFLGGLTLAAYSRFRDCRHEKILQTCFAALALVAICGTVSRTLLWQDNLLLFQDTVRKSPDFLPAQNEYAIALYAAGRKDEANAHINSLQVPDDLINYQYGLVNKAYARVQSDDYEGARRLLRKALENPGKHEVMILQRLLKLNEVQIKNGKAQAGAFYSDDVQFLERLYEITRDPFYQYRLGQTHMFKGDRAKAGKAFQCVVAHAPENVYYLSAARKLLQKMSE